MTVYFKIYLFFSLHSGSVCWGYTLCWSGYLLQVFYVYYYHECDRHIVQWIRNDYLIYEEQHGDTILFMIVSSHWKIDCEYSKVNLSYKV